jgi:cytochrome c oxidase subunit II
MNWLLDPSVSTFGPDIDNLYYIILVITGIVFFVTEGLLVYFLVKYRRKDGQKAEYLHGSTKAEVIWTAIPFVVVLVLALMSKPLWDQIKEPGLVPDNAYQIEVVARQFEWEARYPGANGEFDAEDSFTLLNRVHVPVNQPIVLHLESEDVIHSFFVPEFRVKQDAVPGMRIPVWFQPEQTGEYVLGCAELCGLGHYRMKGTVTVHEGDAFDRWLQSSGEMAFDERPGADLVVADHAGHTGH